MNAVADKTWLADPTLTERLAGHLADPKLAESWKYSKFEPFQKMLETFPPESRGLQPSIAHNNASYTKFSETVEHDLAYINAFLQRTASRLLNPELDLVKVRSADGWLIDVGEQSRTSPLVIDHGSGLGLMIVRVQPGSHLHLLECGSGDDQGTTLYIDVAENASVTHEHIDLDAAHRGWRSLYVRLRARSHYRGSNHIIATGTHRLETQIDLAGDACHASLKGTCITLETGQVDQRITVEHLHANTRSVQRFHNVAAHRSRSTFNGRIHIHPGAKRSDAQLTNRNLVLHGNATMHTKPELEIYNDDVQCAHGATVGQLSRDSLFYLISRGISTQHALRLLLTAFVGECIDGDAADEVRASVQQVLAGIETQGLALA